MSSRSSPSRLTERLWARAAAEPFSALSALVVVCSTAWVVVYPFFLVTHPPLTDLPIHAANVSILRHYFDPAWHFREQFVIDWLGVPYVTSYALGALLAFVLPIEWAMKITAITMLLLLPAGLAVLFLGMKKSPLWGVLGLGLVWSDLTHWGFLNAVGALGLYAMAVGVALLLVERPTRGRSVALGVVLVLVLETHPFRFPFALVGVVLAALLAPQRGRAFRAIAAPSIPAIALMALFFVMRPASLRPKLEGFGLHRERLHRLREYLFNGYTFDVGRIEISRAWQMLAVVSAVIAIGSFLALKRRDAQQADASTDARRWQTATLLPFFLMVIHLIAFLVLPVRLGEWWYVYPRELVAAVYIVLGAFPEQPRAPLFRLAAVCAIAIATGRMASLVAGQWRLFERENADFRQIAALVPHAPRLFYLVFDHRGGAKTHSPYVHLPAWIQAKKGGWLGFHAAGWGLFPVRYRAGSKSAPPILPRDWEWEPQHFRVLEQGRGFDTFLVRHTIDPAPLFAADSSVQLVARRGRWWLYRRVP